LAPIVSHGVEQIGGTLTFELKRAPLSRFERAMKRGTDIVLAGTALLVLVPFMLLVAAAIRLDTPGPVFFRQKRIGFNGLPFLIYKFRTMSVLEDGPIVRQAVAGDSRVTRVGKWLRRTSIDELPQLVNVLRGEMSLVGPRPHAEAHDTEFDRALADYALRQHVKPGITGWAQVNGYRGETPSLTSIQHRVEHDIWYIDNWSIWMEIRILIKTVGAVIEARNAH